MYSHLPLVLSAFVAGTLGQPLITRGVPFQPRAGSVAAPLDTAPWLVTPGVLKLLQVNSWLGHYDLQSSCISATWQRLAKAITGVLMSQANVLLGASYQQYRHTGMDDTVRQTVAVTTRLGFPRTPWRGCNNATSKDLVTVLSSCNGLDYTVMAALTVKNSGLCFLGGGSEDASLAIGATRSEQARLRGEPQYLNGVPCVLPTTFVVPSFATLEDPELPTPDKPEETLDGLKVIAFLTFLKKYSKLRKRWAKPNAQWGGTLARTSRRVTRWMEDNHEDLAPAWAEVWPGRNSSRDKSETRITISTSPMSS
ncbi:hypothetical protein EDB89DRAFT_1902115 [Lactarius sanguifluus]|nr:hypothetical protein EDB89DRAFT_1902115 [Lactarius sanguifluus]